MAFFNLGGKQIAQTTADAGGVVSAAATVADLPPDGQPLFAFDNSASCESSSTYQVIEQLPAPPLLVCTITASPSVGASAGASTVPNLSVGDQLLFAFNTTTTCETSRTFAVLSQPAPTTTAEPVLGAGFFLGTRRRNGERSQD